MQEAPHDLTCIVEMLAFSQLFRSGAQETIHLENHQRALKVMEINIRSQTMESLPANAKKQYGICSDEYYFLKFCVVLGLLCDVILSQLFPSLPCNTHVTVP